MTKIQTLYNILKDGKLHSSLELSKRVKTVCIATRVSELRQRCGYDLKVEIHCIRKNNVWYYRMVS